MSPNHPRGRFLKWGIRPSTPLLKSLRPDNASIHLYLVDRLDSNWHQRRARSQAAAEAAKAHALAVEFLQGRYSVGEPGRGGWGRDWYLWQTLCYLVKPRRDDPRFEWLKLRVKGRPSYVSRTFGLGWRIESVDRFYNVMFNPEFKNWVVRE